MENDDQAHQRLLRHLPTLRQARGLPETGPPRLSENPHRGLGPNGSARRSGRRNRRLQRDHPAQHLRAIANRAQATEDDISQAIAAGWAQGVQNATSDGILTREEETNLRDFRDLMAD